MNPYIFQGAMKGFQDASATLLAVSQRKQQLEKEDKRFGLDMKIKKLQLEGLQEKMSPEQLEYNKTLQGLEMKDHKLKTKKAEIDLNKARTEAEIFQKVAGSYLEGAEQGEADGLRQGFDLGGVQYDLDVGAVSGVPLKRITPTEQLKREKALKELSGDFGRKVKEATQRVKGGESFADIALELETEYPKQYTSEIDKYLRKSLGVTEEKKLSYTEQCDEDIRKAEAGKVGWDELKTKYPRKREEIEDSRRETLPKLERSPKFRMGTGLSAYFNKDIANIDKTTLDIIDQIENEEDLKELLEREDEAKIKGIDIDAILEYFGKTREEVGEKQTGFRGTSGGW